MRQQLVEKRIKANLSRKQMAELVGISTTMYFRIEKGERTPSLDVAMRIAKQLNCSVEELFSDEDLKNFSH